MAHINLLPWREERRKEQLKQFLTMLGLSVVLMILIILAVHLQYNRMISAQESRNNFLSREITAVEKQIREINTLSKEKKRLLARMEVIQQLQRNRPGIVHLFEEMVKVIPEGSYIKSLKQSGKNLTINGVAQSNARVSAYMRNIDSSDWLTKPVLNIIQKKGKTKSSGGRDFILRAEQLAQPKTATKK
ncbi:MAG: PilN domain-containing protein [Woeseiaceae bacterium]